MFYKLSIGDNELPDNMVGEVAVKDFNVNGVYFPEIRWDELYSKEINIPELKLIENTEFVDFLDSLNLGWSGIVISQKVKEIFNKFNLPEHVCYAVNIYREDKLYDESKLYYFINFSSKELPYLDSLDVDLYKGGVGVIRTLSNISYKEILDLERKTNDLIQVREIRFNKTVLQKYKPDLLYDRHIFHGDVYISERLKNQLEKEAVTGALFKPAKKIIVVS